VTQPVWRVPSEAWPTATGFSEVNFGREICGTAGTTENFALNSYSLTRGRSDFLTHHDDASRLRRHVETIAYTDSEPGDDLLSRLGARFKLRPLAPCTRIASAHAR
jgi:hypothetical protein